MSRLYVFAPVAGGTRLCGRIDWLNGRGRFLYSPDWLSSPDAYPLDPRNLPMQAGPMDTTLNNGVHGVLADAGPDDWGRMLIEHERGSAAVNDPLEILRLSNGAGTGALLFSQSRERPAPPRTVAAHATLPELESAARTLSAGGLVSDRAMQLMFEHGSSLGGARPKALVDLEGEQWIAKFGRDNDLLDVPRLEWACLQLAQDAGIEVAEHRLEVVNKRAVLLVRRFDREEGKRIHYLSLHALLSMERVGPADITAPDGMYSYFGAASLYRQIGVPDAATRVFDRMLFNVLIGNTDDHTRNHGLLLRNGRWDMTPSFDLVATGGSVHAIGLGSSGRNRSLDNAFSALSSFGLTEGRARIRLQRIQSAILHAPERLDEAGMQAAERDIAIGRMFL